MAEEFKFNEKTGMYEIVKDDQKKQKAKERIEDRYGESREYDTTDRFARTTDDSQKGKQQDVNRGSVQSDEERTVYNQTHQGTNTSESKTEVNHSNHNSDYHTSSYNHPYNTPGFDQDGHDSESNQDKQSQANSGHSHHYSQQQRRPQSGIEDILENEQLMATLAWVGTIVGLFVLNVSLIFIIIPIIFYVLYDKKSDFVRAHSREAINVCISVVIYGGILGIGSFTIGAILMMAKPIFMMGSVLSVLSLIGVGIYALIVCIQGAMAANNDKPYIPPLTIRFLKK